MPPLSERDPNRMSSAADAKRKRVDVDLTLSEDEAAVPAKSQKNARTQQQASSSQQAPSTQQGTFSQQGASAYQTPPASSVPFSHDGMYGFRSTQPNQQHSQTERTSWLADADDVNMIIATSQDDGEGTDMLHLYGELSIKIVGVQYYRGLANPGEHILIRREPGNPYDKNAIRIDNMAGTQMGHIARTVAEKLSKFIDNRSLHVEGQLAGEIGRFDCPLTVHLFGPDPTSEEGQQLVARMKAVKLGPHAHKEAKRAAKQRERERQTAEARRLAEARRAAGGGKGGRIPSNASSSQYANEGTPGPSSQLVMSDILEASQRFNVREMGRATETHGVSEDTLKNMPMAAQPEIIETKMLPYQLQALRWLLDQESPKAPAPGSRDSVQLWSRQHNNPNAFTNLATCFSTKEPTLTSGGILADDMGLGKTLEMISLICADAQRFGRGTTLIVAPLSVMSNWSGQIAHHVKSEHAMKIYTYHGAGRVKMAAKDFAAFDVVITTYQTLAADFMPRGKSNASSERKLRADGLFSMEWRRVILDEGHIVRNPQTKGAASIVGLTARSRWVLTGTPIVNSLKDLYSLLRFVGVTGGLEQLAVFNTVLIRPLKANSESAVFLLKAIMRAFVLRRRKDMAFIDLKLPPLEEYIHRIDFTGKERQRYEALALEAQGLLHKFQTVSAAPGQASAPTYQHLLEILLRMRQCCNHWQLCGERLTKLVAQLEANKTVDLTPENQQALQDLLQIQIESQEDCAVCLETLHTPVITTCSHSFGLECISKVIDTQHKCPMCRAPLKDESCLVHASNGCGDGTSTDDLDLNESSTKLEAMLKILSATKASGDKTVIFSQWTKFLDIFQARLVREGYKFCRLDGSMSAAKRDEALEALEKDPETRILLASLGVCAVGLNLTAANQVILSDSWWAPAIEDQAVDRVHRLGQQKETRVFRLVMDKSIEQNTLDIQKEKRALMLLAFSERSNKRDASARSGQLQDIQRLLAR